jgi:hypothetical protein
VEGEEAAGFYRSSCVTLDFTIGTYIYN